MAHEDNLGKAEIGNILISQRHSLLIQHLMKQINLLSIFFISSLLIALSTYDDINEFLKLTVNS